MANSIHTDSSDPTSAGYTAGSPGRTTGKPPIVLARLPRVGAAPPVAVSPPAIHIAPEPEAMPQLDLRTEIEQRTQLHIANTPRDDQNLATSHFADRQHEVERQPSVRQPSLASHTTSYSRHNSAKTQATPDTFSEKLFRLHARVAPHAGVIVALALIASAGLLYWMIVGPTQGPMPNSFDNFGENFSFQQEPEGFAVEVPQEVESVSSSDQWTNVPLPKAELTQQPQSLPAIDEPIFPTSNAPEALDFTKVGPLPSSPSSTHDLQPFPEVARQPAATTIR